MTPTTYQTLPASRFLPQPERPPAICTVAIRFTDDTVAAAWRAINRMIEEITNDRCRGK